MISFYVPPALGLELLPAIAAKQPGELWLNLGTESDALLAAAAANGLRTQEICSIIRIGFRPADFP